MFDKLAVKGKINRLDKCRRDLVDDSRSVEKINRKINDIIDDLYDFIGSAASASASKLEGYKESSQYNDSDIKNARHYLQKEINRLEEKLDD